MLNLGQNKLDDEGFMYIADALKANKNLNFLDLFDADVGDLGAQQLAEGLLNNKTLMSLRMSNTTVTAKGGLPLIE